MLLVLLVPPVGVALLGAARTRAQLNGVAAGAAVLSLAFVLLLIAQVLGQGPVAFASGLLYVDALSALVFLIVGLVGFSALLYSIDYMGRDGSPHPTPVPRLRRYYAFVLLFLLTMYLVLEADNLGLLWIALEATTLVSALLVAHYGTRRAQEASWKYLILCSAGLAFALFGTLLLYLASVRTLGASASGLDWTTLLAAAPRLDPGLVRLALIFLFVGYGTKAGLAPLHTWLPDAHSEAPTPVSALLSGALLNCAMYALIRIDALTRPLPGFDLNSALFLVFGLLSVFLAALFLYTQRDLKRLLAYSSVENMGIISLGLAFGGAIGVFGSLLQMLNHATTKAALFLLGGSLAVAAGTKDLEKIQGTLAALPATGLLLLVSGLAIAGVPPFSLFSSEFLIVSAGFSGGDPVAAALLLTALGLVFGGLLIQLLRVLLGAPHHPFGPPLRATVGLSLAVGVLVAFAVGLGLVLPDPLLHLLRAAARVVTG